MRIDLDTALRARGFEPLIDRSEIYAFEEWWQRIEALIARADTIVFVLSPDSVASEIALKEVTFAASLNKRFAPIVCREVSADAIPDALARLQFISFAGDAEFEDSADRLAEALNSDIAWVRRHTEWGEQARRWASARNRNGLLLRSPVLEEAEQWIAARPKGAPVPTDVTQTFITLSRQAASRRSRNVIIASLTALGLALALAGFAIWQRGVATTEGERADKSANEARTRASEAEKARATAEQETVRSLIREARLHASQENYGLSVATALRAHGIAGSNLDAATHREMIRTLYDSVLNSRERFVLPTRSDEFKFVSFLPNAPIVLTISNEPPASGSVIRTWDALTGQLLQEYEPPHLMRFGDQVAFSRDGKDLLTYGAVPNLFAFDVLPAGIRFRAAIKMAEATTFADFSEDGKSIITGSSQGRLQVRNSKTLTESHEYLADPAGLPVSYAHLSGSKLIAITSTGGTGNLISVDISKAGSSPKTRKLNCAGIGIDSQEGVFRGTSSPASFYLPCGSMYARLVAETGVTVEFKLPELADFIGGLVISAASQIQGDEIALLSYGEGAIYLFDRGVLKRKFVPHRRARFLSGGVRVAETESRLFLSASNDGTARIWRVTRDRPVASLAGHGGEVRSARLARKGSVIATAANDKTARIWSLWPQVVSFAATGIGNACNGKGMADGQEFGVSKSYNNFIVKSADTEIRRFRPADGGQMQAYCISPNSKYLLLATQYGMLEVVEIGTWETVGRLDLSALAYGSDTLTDLRVSEDGKRYIASFPKFAVTWPIMESSDELLVHARAVVPRISAAEPASRTKITLEPR